MDDWFAISYSPPAVHELLHGHYVTSLVDYGGRYRPAYAVLTYFQWIVLGDHGHSTALPTLFGLARLLFFMAVAAAMTMLLLRGKTSKVQAAVWASLASVVIVWTPGIATNFVRFGVAEPTGLAFVALSLLVMAPAIRSLAFDEGGRLRVGQLLRLMGGYVLYLLGVYMWEALVAVIVVLPALYFWMRQGPRRQGTSRRVWWVIGAAAVLLTAPLVHITAEVLVNGHLDASSAAAGRHGLLPALLGGVLPTLGGALTRPQSLLCCALPFYVIPRCTRAARQGDRTALICLATLGAGLLAAYISYAGSDNLSRYYIPWIAALVVTGAWSLSTSPNRKELSLAALALASLTVVVGRTDLQIANWINLDRIGSSAITVVGDASATGCRVYLVGFPPERAVGVARLIPSAVQSPLSACSRGSSRALAVRWPGLTARSPTWLRPRLADGDETRPDHATRLQRLSHEGANPDAGRRAHPTADRSAPGQTSALRPRKLAQPLQLQQLLERFTPSWHELQGPAPLRCECRSRRHGRTPSTPRSRSSRRSRPGADRRRLP